MEQKLFVTRIDSTHLHGKNKYVRGVIMGMMVAICESDRDYAIKAYRLDGDRFLRRKTSPESYERFKEMVEARYPGLCEFDCGIVVEDSVRKVES